MRHRRSLTAVALALGLATLLASAVPASASTDLPTAAGQGFAAEARAAGLTAAEAGDLQNRVNQRLAQTGGKQTTANKIEYGPGDYMLLSLPGEQYARELSQPVATQATCSYYNFCVYQQQTFGGDMLAQSSCSKWIDIPWTGYGSYINNQTANTRARFLDELQQLYQYSLPAPNSNSFYNWNPVYFVDPC